MQWAKIPVNLTGNWLNKFEEGANMEVVRKPVNGAKIALKLSFDAWVRNHKSYSVLHKTLPSNALLIVDAAFSEMANPRPEGFQVWWMKEHDRFIRLKPQLRQREILLVGEIIYYFLCAYCRGELKKKDEQPKPTATQPEQKTTKKKAAS